MTIETKLTVAAAAGVILFATACSGGAEAEAAATTEAAETEATTAEEAAPAEAASAEPAEAEEEAVDLSAAASGLYKADQGHRYITFSYSHQGYSAPYIRWRAWDSELNWNAEDVTKSSVSVTIDANSVDTGVDKFDEHMKSGDIFDIAQFPTASFVSTAIERTGANTGKITGDLTIKGVTKPVVLDAKINRAAFNERAKAHKIGFSATTSILRSDFGVDYAVPFVGDEVDIIIEVEYDEVTSAE